MQSMRTKEQKVCIPSEYLTQQEQSTEEIDSHFGKMTLILTSWRENSWLKWRKNIFGETSPGLPTGLRIKSIMFERCIPKTNHIRHGFSLRRKLRIGLKQRKWSPFQNLFYLMTKIPGSGLAKKYFEHIDSGLLKAEILNIKIC